MAGSATRYSVVLVDYFKDLFSSCEANGSQDVDVLSCIPTVIDDEMNGMLSQDFNE